MIRKVARRILPQWPGWPSDTNLERYLREVERRHDSYRKALEQHLNEQFRELIEQVNSQVQGVGAEIASATRIKPTNAIHVVTGAEQIENIDPPNAQLGVESDHVTPRYVSSFTGPIWLIPAAGSTWELVTGGNIAKAATATPLQAMAVIYDGASWYPAA